MSYTLGNIEEEQTVKCDKECGVNRKENSMNIKIKANGEFYFYNCFCVICSVESEEKCPSYNLKDKGDRERSDLIVRDLLAKNHEVTLIPVSY